MKTTGHLVFYISENEDFELWRILTQISPEERTAFVKNAIKKAIIQNSPRYSNSSGITSMPKMERRPSFETKEFEYEAAASAKDNEDHLSGLQLDELIMTSDIPQDKGALPGLDFLLNNVIGEEDDEVVIDFIKNRIMSNEP